MVVLATSLINAIKQSKAAGVSTHIVTPTDYRSIGRVHDHVFGPGALTRSAYRIREGLPQHSRYCRIARNDKGEIIGFVRFAPVRVGGVAHVLMLGPLAVVKAFANQGHARRLIAEGVMAAAADGQRLVVLVGDVAYYGRLGFVPIPSGQITWPGPVDQARLLALELEAGALADYRGVVTGDATSR